MKKVRSAALCLGFLLPFLAGQAFSQVQINKIDWQISKVEGKQKLPYETITELKITPQQKFQYKLRAVVTAQNLAFKPADGLVLRYSLSLHIVKTGDNSFEGFWAVPFKVEEVRISKIKAGGLYEARLIHFVLNEQLKKLRNTGFWADALRLSVMLEPRQGDVPASIMRESVIDIKP